MDGVFFALWVWGLAHLFEQSFRHDGGGFCDSHAGILQCLDFGCSGAFTTGDDGSGVAHAASGRRGGAGDECSNGFGAVLADPFCGFFFGATANFADHDDALGIGVGFEHFDDVEV